MFYLSGKPLIPDKDLVAYSLVHIYYISTEVDDYTNTDAGIPKDAHERE